MKMNNQMARNILFLMVSFFVCVNLNAQILNDECRFATPILSTDNFCSRDGEFTNVGAKPDPTFTNSCVSILWRNGVWFSFTPKEPGALIRVFGVGHGGTLRNPKIVVFSDCNTYLECSPGKSIGVDELQIDGLTIGKTYYIMVESAPGNEGTFKLCVDDFIPVPTPEADCRDGVILCDKSSFKVESLTGDGNVRNEIESGNCMEQEFQSAWYKWTCDQSGTLTFTLTPNDFVSLNVESDDLDFSLYELPNGINDCSGKRLVKCMAAGANTTNGAVNPLSNWIQCNGPTGLRDNENGETESPGCLGGNNNFLSPLNMVSGRSYVLVVNNYSRSGLGFAIDFGGTGTFLGPKPDFEINANQAFECDKSVLFTNKSSSEADPIKSYTWSFGDRAVPGNATGIGPNTVTYQSFGTKIAALTVESNRGCTVTKIKEFFVEPCCKDTSTLDLEGLVTDLRCFNTPEGQILARGIRGAPEYSYSLESQPFRPNPLYGNLAAGSYKVRVQDIKGCKDSIIVVVEQPELIVVNAGPDVEIELGDSTILNINYDPNKGKDKITIAPPAVQVIDSLTYVVMPGNTTTYVVTVTDSLGCTATDEVTIRVIKNLQVYAPNIISPVNNDGNNDFFNIWASKGVKNVELLEIYDRWGNLVFRGVDGLNSYKRNDTTSGWNGTFKGSPVVTGVYTWRALVRWLDDSTSNHAGDVTVIAAQR
jgi:gliding motility-associated-like protein